MDQVHPPYPNDLHLNNQNTNVESNVIKRDMWAINSISRAFEHMRTTGVGNSSNAESFGRFRGKFSRKMTGLIEEENNKKIQKGMKEKTIN